ncbi:MAG: hypothetical protein OZSIB_0758 [Candidatus Ozemobacter sibiricus]|uniref:Uncharacterized protein n=1 Tax=Candidatus Ozemobacter sibiricus TaxID=2268124 RepID=A0A367ZTZ6_9BACT|nr:MAG: hypothetical protein OZSIB_0758 [Candidatus Ozemobacter sibiricus]
MFYAVVFVVVVLTIFTAQFHRLTRHQQQTAYRLEENDIARQIAEAAMDEAFAWLHATTADVCSPPGQWLIANRQAPLSLTFPLSHSFSSSMVPAGVSLELRGTARVIDFRQQDSRGNRYDDGTGRTQEGQGTIALEVDVVLRRSSLLGSQPPLATCRLIRHHDFTIVPMVSPRDNASQRNGYSQCFPLDYVLFVRHGLQEFRDGGGQSLNHQQVIVMIDQDQLPPARRGKIFFGHADGTSPGTSVFLNLSEKFANQVIPVPSNLATFTIQQADVFQLLPFLPTLVEQEVKAQEGSVRTVSMSGAKGHFSIQTLPMVSARFTPRQLELRDSLAALQSGAEANLAPGLELVSGQPVRAGEPAFVESICEGAIRKRFWYLVTFILDLTEAKIHVSGKKKGKSYSVTVPIDPQEAEKLKALEKRSLCLEWRGPPPADPIQRDFLQNLPLINAKYSGHLPLFSRFISDFTYGGSQGDLGAPPANAHFPLPRLFNSKGQTIRADTSGPEGLRPYSHFNFWFRQRVSPHRLTHIGVFDPIHKRLHLRGIAHVAGPLELGEPSGQPWTIHGQGVLIADQFRIVGPLRKATPESLCVLFTRKGAIQVATDQAIDAFLIASGDHGYGSVRPSRTLNLHGGMFVDRLDTQMWPPGPHRIAYDPFLKQPTDHVYQINISRWVTFQRLTEIEGGNT